QGSSLLRRPTPASLPVSAGISGDAVSIDNDNGCSRGGLRSMLAAKVFFSFAEITDPSKHRAYNEWHHLDHRPENLLLPGVIWGERWVRTPDCMEASIVSDPRFAAFHYMNLYWFDAPA